MTLPDHCWAVRKGREIIDRIPDDGTVDSAVDLLAYMRLPESEKIKIRYGECKICERCK